MKRLLLIATMSVAFMSNPLMADGTAVVKVHSHAFTWSFIFQNVQYTLGGDRKFHFQIPQPFRARRD
jgi:hypothetical protein